MSIADIKKMEYQKQVSRPNTFMQQTPKDLDKSLFDEDGELMEKEHIKLQQRYHDTSKRFMDNVGEDLMDIDGFAKKMLDEMPNQPSEIVYRITLNTLSKTYAVFFIIGVLIILTVLAFTLNLGVA